MSNINFSEKAWHDYLYWQVQEIVSCKGHYE